MSATPTNGETSKDSSPPSSTRSMTPSSSTSQLSSKEPQLSSSGEYVDVYIASASKDRRVKVWNPSNGLVSHVLTLDDATAEATCLASLPDGRLIVGSSSGVITIWRLAHANSASKGIQQEEKTNDESSLSNSEWRCQYRLKGHSASVTCIIALPGLRIASGSADCTIKLWRIPDDISAQDNGELNYIRTYKGHADDVTCLCLLPDRRIASGSKDVTIKIWHLTRTKCEMTLRGHAERVTSLTLLSDGRLVSSSEDRSIAVWNITDRQCDFTLEGHSGPVLGVYKLKDGRLVSCSADNTVKVWQVQTGSQVAAAANDTFHTRCLYTLKGHKDHVVVITELPDGRIVSASHDRTLRIWNLSTKLCDRAWEAHSEKILSAIVFYVPPFTFTSTPATIQKTPNKDRHCCEGSGGCLIM